MNVTDSVESREHGTNVSSLHSIILIFPTAIIILLTILGNVLVLRFKARVGRTNTTLFVWNLGLTDFLVGIIVLPLAAIHLFKRKWIFGRMLCRIWVAADVTFCTCSVVTICIISVDRYLSVTRPLQYKSIVTKHKVIVVIILIWVFSTSILVTTVRWEQTNFRDQEECFAGNEIRYLAHSVVFAFFLPASVTLTLYWRVYKLAKNRQRALDRGFLMILGHNMNFLTNTLSQTTALRVHIGPNNGMVEHQRRVLRTHERIAKTLGVVSCSFLFCWLPFFILYLTNYSCDGCLPTFIIDIASWLGYCNSMLNPIIYSFTVKEFKKSTIRMILPLWIFFHNMCPNIIQKPSEQGCRTITRNIVSKNKHRKNRQNQVYGNNMMMENDRRKYVIGKATNSQNGCVDSDCTSVTEKFIRKQQKEKCEKLRSLTISNVDGKGQYAIRKMSEPAYHHYERQQNVRSQSIDKFFDQPNSVNETVNRTTMTSGMTSSLSILSSESVKKLIMQCKIKYPKRHSLPTESSPKPTIFKTRRRYSIQITQEKWIKRRSELLGDSKVTPTPRGHKMAAENDTNLAVVVAKQTAKQTLLLQSRAKSAEVICAKSDKQFRNSKTDEIHASVRKSQSIICCTTKKVNL